ncbi:MAG TPA: patatin-like protein [Actinomycetota bacterium]|nr:patatin-like protein [Actinomycetota bacterium]
MAKHDPAPAEDDQGPVRELRVALVCYGGVSLAIYMHGTTKEIHKLVIASNGRDLSPERNPFPAGTTEGVYWELLRHLERRDGIRTRVVVDIVSGTSAGGINGIFLAKALAGNLDQQGLRALWLRQGDIHKLTHPHWLPLPLRFAAWGAKGMFTGFRGKPPLDGDFLLRQAFGALEGMDGRRGDIGGTKPATLMPPGHDLRLFVTTTDFHGYQRLAPAYAPIQVPSEWHRHIYAFERTHLHDAFGRAYNGALAFAARSTSSFPGAFPPAHLADLDTLPAKLPSDYDREFFPTYRLAGRRPEDAWFVDGGVLDNFPFRAAIRAIFGMPASSEVDRRLLYIEPDPGAKKAAAAAGPGEPGFLATVFGSLSSIPATQPIAGALLDLRDFNHRVDRVEDVIDQAQQAIEKAVGDAGDTVARQEAPTLNGALHEAAARQQSSYAAYVRLKVRSVLDGMASAAAALCDFPAGTDQAAFVTDAIKRWAESGPLRDEIPPDSEEVVDFLKTFDLGYAVRRLTFVLKGLNGLYATADDTPDPPSRAQLDEVKRLLWGMIARITEPTDDLRLGSVPADESVLPVIASLRERVRKVFTLSEIDRCLATPADTWDGVVETFVEDRTSQIDTVRSALDEYLNKRLDGIGAEMLQRIRDATKDWGDAGRRLVVRYEGFPLWDAVLYPMQKVADLGELNRVEVVRMSPDDATLLTPTGNKLSGVTLHHFGAFFDTDGRANDYVWGRLDGAERLVWLLLHDRTGDPAAFDRDAYVEYARRAFEAVTREEAELRSVAPKPFAAVDADRRQAGTPAATGTAGAEATPAARGEPSTHS